MGRFGKKDFGPVVEAFKALLDEFSCGVCNSLIYLTPNRGPAESLRCECGEINFNMKSKPKSG